jgi:HK97 family phage major capsid protein
MALQLSDVASLLAEEVKGSIKKSKIETAAEMKKAIPSMIAEALGTGTPGYKSLSEMLLKEISQRIPSGSLFDGQKGAQYDPETGFKGMGKKAAEDLAQRTLFAITPRNLRSELFSGERAKALSVSTGSSGGYTLPEEFVAEVARKLVHASVFLGSCRVWSNVDMIGKMPRETGTVAVSFQAELTQPSNTQFSLGSINWSLQKRFSLTQLPQELWKFSGIDVLNLLATMFAEQFQKTEDYYYLNGSGSLQPMGLLTQQTGMNTLSIASSSLQWQDLNKTKHSIKSQYRNEKGSCIWMMNNNTIELVSALADDQNRPIFIDRGPEGIAGPSIPPQTVGFILGYPVLENPYTPGPVAENSSGTVTSTATTSQIIFSNLNRGYFAFKGPTMEVKTSDEAYDAFINDGLYTRAIDFIDGKPAIPEATAILSGVK